MDEQKSNSVIAGDSLDLDTKLSVINAYRNILTHKLPSKKIDESVYEAMQTEFRAWVESRIRELLNAAPAKDAPKPTDLKQLTDAEVTFVKALKKDFDRTRKSNRGYQMPQIPQPRVDPVELTEGLEDFESDESEQD
jgi:hypothetical protein